MYEARTFLRRKNIENDSGPPPAVTAPAVYQTSFGLPRIDWNGTEADYGQYKFYGHSPKSKKPFRNLMVMHPTSRT